MACPYGVRYLNETELVVEKCTLCEQKIAQGELPQCVSQCGGRARWFGDIEGGFDNLTGTNNLKLGAYLDAYSADQIYYLPDVGNKPSFAYILRNHKWQGGGA
jgi:Fe-S-cluster-containing dehydrogenase component